jgi:hypothetical protein
MRLSLLIRQKLSIHGFSQQRFTMRLGRIAVDWPVAKLLVINPRLSLQKSEMTMAVIE